MGAQITATRLLDRPVIRPHMDERMGDNINGPSVIRVPDWAPNPLGRYYLYFADHQGSYIRLAYANRIIGPWTIHTPGALDIADSLFPAVDPPPPPAEEVPDFADSLGHYLYAHIASPDVHVDHRNRCFRMYYHGLVENGDQWTRAATSRDGLTFTPRAPILGPPYFRVFEYRNAFFTVPWMGAVWRSEAWDRPFEEGPTLIPLLIEGAHSEGFRHGECHRAGDRLHLFFHRIGDAPESILHTEVDLRPDWRDWRIGEVHVVMRPDLPWEGGDLPIAPSVMGAVHEKARELRDPCIFVDEDEQVYLFYVGGGEQGIGVALLEGL